MGPSFAGRGAIEFPAFNIPWMLEVSAEQFSYLHVGDFDTSAPRNAPCVAGAPWNGNRGCVTTIGPGTGSVYVPSFTAQDRDLDLRLGVQVAWPRIYLGVGYLWRTDSYGYPEQTGVGFGVEKLPDLDHALSLFGSYWYYPSIQGNFTDPTSGIGYALQYRDSKYQLGAALSVPFFSNAGVFIEGGFMGDRGYAKQFAPDGFIHEGFFAGVGIRF